MWFITFSRLINSSNSSFVLILHVSSLSFVGPKIFLNAILSNTINLWRERERESENQQDATIRCLLSTLPQHVSGIIMPIFRRTKTVCYCMRYAALVLLDVVGSGYGALRCWVRALWRLLFNSCKTVLAPCNAAPHNRYQPHPTEPAQQTACSNTRSLFSWRWV